MSYTTVQDVEAEWNQQVPDGSLVHVQRLIEKAERLLVRRIPDLADRIDDDRLTEADVVDVVCSMVLRVLRNPTGFRSESAGDYSYSADAASASGRIQLLPSERRLLVGGTGGAFTIRPYVWPPVEYGGGDVSLLDSGPDTVMVFPEESFTDSYGNVQRRPAQTGVTVAGCHVQPMAATQLFHVELTGWGSGWMRRGGSSAGTRRWGCGRGWSGRASR